MRYRSLPLSVEAFCFDGTEAGAQAAQDWVSSYDIENAEVTYQGGKEPYALDVTTAEAVYVLEAGDFLCVRNGTLYGEKGANFLAAHEEAK